MAIGILWMEVTLTPCRISRFFGLDALFSEITPEQVHIRHVENHSSQSFAGLPCCRLRIGESALGRQREENVSFTPPYSTTIPKHSQDVPVKPHGSFHVPDIESNCRDLFNLDFHGWSHKAVLSCRTRDSSISLCSTP